MSRILIAYATGEGQTRKIAQALEGQFQALGHTVRVADLTARGNPPDPAAHDAVVVAASVHAGRHQKHALRFVTRHRDALTQRPNAFLSVSLFAAASKEAGLQQAREQVNAFLEKAGWQPEHVEMVAGAFRMSRMGWFGRWVLRRMLGLFRRELERTGWPDVLGGDAEYTDWDALHRFGERFAAALSRA